MKKNLLHTGSTHLEPLHHRRRCRCPLSSTIAAVVSVSSLLHPSSSSSRRPSSTSSFHDVEDGLLFRGRAVDQLLGSLGDRLLFLVVVV